MWQRTSKVINIANDFTKTPGGRYKTDGPYSAEEFRDTILIPICQEHVFHGVDINVNLDGAIGYSKPFLEEVFGGFVRKDPVLMLHSDLSIDSTEFPNEVSYAIECIRDAYNSTN